MREKCLSARLQLGHGVLSSRCYPTGIACLHGDCTHVLARVNKFTEKTHEHFISQTTPTPRCGLTKVSCSRHFDPIKEHNMSRRSNSRQQKSEPRKQFGGHKKQPWPTCTDLFNGCFSVEMSFVNASIDKSRVTLQDCW